MLIKNDDGTVTFKLTLDAAKALSDMFDGLSALSYDPFEVSDIYNADESVRNELEDFQKKLGGL